MSQAISSTEFPMFVQTREISSCWETVPFDIVTSLLPYLDLDNSENILALSGDPYLDAKLCQDPNGILWKYLYTHVLSETLPSSLTPTLKERYYTYRGIKGTCHTSYLATWSCQRGYEIVIRNLVNRKLVTDEKCREILCFAAMNGHLNIVKYLITNGTDPGDLGMHMLIGPSHPQGHPQGREPRRAKKWVY